jgi:hypothetical protein
MDDSSSKEELAACGGEHVLNLDLTDDSEQDGRHMQL